MPFRADAPPPLPEPEDIRRAVKTALAEDVGSGDITAALVAETSRHQATVIAREAGVICGRAWVEEVFWQVDNQLSLEWQVSDGQTIEADSMIFRARGSTRSLLTAERTALNFLQLLSGTATRARHYADLIAHTQVRLLDTRKTIPGLRLAQKYAVRCGGCHNHRIGLYDAYLIKENHIAGCGGIASAITMARNNNPDSPVEVEVENLAELEQAVNAGADRIMLDNFPLPQLQQAVALAKGKAELEASGGINDNTLVAIAETGVDFISIGALTKDCRALDLSMRLGELAE